MIGQIVLAKQMRNRSMFQLAEFWCCLNPTLIVALVWKCIFFRVTHALCVSRHGHLFGCLRPVQLQLQPEDGHVNVTFYA